ncbi:putative zinc finger CCHC domain-containing protein [Phytophthora citrophthora]|uniref:Zinc finger CCHC domain-containing protein n=1 Tax=Phytophthora citrophthora TaxID=4793 RepID=A0AAD9LPX5_9STRA|nr:putative zinc finger CCHC domain-containing protein [Phytophthora citrophthora]
MVSYAISITIFAHIVLSNLVTFVMSLQFLGQKSWHPASKANQKRVWVAEQQAKEREQREKEKAKEVRKAADALQAQQAAAAAGDIAAARRAASQQVNFLYAAPPGLPEAKETARKTHQTQIQEDAAVREFRRKAERRGDSQRSKLERYVGRRAEETLTIKDQVERFPMLKDAPVEGKYTETIKVNFNPVGLRLRNVRCIRCGEWGHQSGDRECKLRDQNPNDATRQRWEDPVTEINKLKSAKQDLVLRRGALPLEMQQTATGEEFEILQSDDEDVEAVEDALLATLSMKQKKKLLKKLEKQARSVGNSNSESDSDESSHRRRSIKTKKSSKHKHRHKHKHRSRSRSKYEREKKSEGKSTSRRRDASSSPRPGKRQRSQRSRSRSCEKAMHR